MTDWVQLVNEQDVEIGVMEKLTAHEQGLLHRALSVFIFNSKGEMLLHQRAAHKYHSALLWTNACCTHPRPSEPLIDAASRRLEEEMGMSAQVNFAFSFIYKAEFENGLTEYEYDHVFIGNSDSIPSPNKDEVAGYKYLSMEKIEEWIIKSPEDFTIWFRLIFDKIKNWKQ